MTDIALLFIFLSAVPAFSAPCGHQNYASLSPPDFNCPSPGELGDYSNIAAETLGVPAGSRLVIGGKTVSVRQDSLLLDKQRVVMLGVRVETLRKLRYLDYQKLLDLHAAKETFQTKLFTSQISVCNERVEQAKKRLQMEFDKGVARELEIKQMHTWYRSPILWFIAGAVMSAGAVFGGALAF